MNLLKNITTASIAGVLLFSLSCDDRLPSESTATVETGSLELSYVFVHGSTSNPTIVGFEVEPWTNTYDNSNEPVSTVATDSDGKRSSHDKEKSNIPVIEAVVIFLSKLILFSSLF